MCQRSVLLAAAIAALLGVSACNPPEDNAKVRSAIEARNQELSAAFAKGDAAAVAAMYTPDAQMFPPNQPLASGHDAVLKGWKDFVDAGFKGLELHTTEVEACGDHADEEGTYTAIGPDGKPADTGKYVVIWKKSNGQWFLHRDIWNSSNPPPPPAAPAAPQAPAEAPAAPPQP